MDEQRKGKVEAVRREVAGSELNADRKVLLQDLLSSADKCLGARTEADKLNAVVEGTSDILTHLARDGIRSEKMMDAKINECKRVTQCRFSWPAAVTVITVSAGLIGLALRLFG